jgi:hypothetical protein
MKNDHLIPDREFGKLMQDEFAAAGDDLAPERRDANWSRIEKRLFRRRPWVGGVAIGIAAAAGAAFFVLAPDATHERTKGPQGMPWATLAANVRELEKSAERPLVLPGDLLSEATIVFTVGQSRATFAALWYTSGTGGEPRLLARSLEASRDHRDTAIGGVGYRLRVREAPLRFCVFTGDSSAELSDFERSGLARWSEVPPERCLTIHGTQRLQE